MAWILQFLGYLGSLILNFSRLQANWDSQQSRARKTSILVLKYPKNCRLHAILVLNLVKPQNLCTIGRSLKLIKVSPFIACVFVVMHENSVCTFNKTNLENVELLSTLWNNHIEFLKNPTDDHDLLKGMESGKNFFSAKETNYHAMFTWLSFTLCTSCVGLNLGYQTQTNSDNNNNSYKNIMLNMVLYNFYGNNNSSKVKMATSL